MKSEYPKVEQVDRIESQKNRSLVLTLAATLIGAAFGVRAADRFVGGSGFSSLLAQLGGALIGGYGGKALGEALQEENKAHDAIDQRDR